MAEIRRRKTRMYEPWGYQDQNDYRGEADIIAVEMDKFFANTYYDDNRKEIVFLNDDGEEKASIDVTQFSMSVIEEVKYDPETKVLTIKFSNGDKVEINLADLVDEKDFKDGLEVVGEPGSGTVKVKIDENSKDYLSVSISGVAVSSGITELEEKAFTNAELKWEADNNGFNIEYFNIKNNSKDIVKLFDTDDNGNVLFSAGQF